MTATEIGVVAVGLLLGYWLVSFFLKSGRPPPRADAPATPPPTGSMAEPMAGPASWSTVLQLAPDATLEEIRAAYFRLAEQYRPDKAQALGPEIQALAAQRLAEIETAYQDALRSAGGAA
jgi:hypothetical protein